MNSRMRGMKDLKAELKNKLWTKKQQVIVPKSSQPQLVKISENPMKYEDNTNGLQSNDAKASKDFIQKGPLDKPGNSHGVNNNVDVLTENFDLIKLNNGDNSNSSSKEQTVSGRIVPNKEFIAEEYVTITENLRQKIEKCPGICSIPFFVHGLPFPESKFSTYVPLPYDIQNSQKFNRNTLWTTIGSQLIKVKDYCQNQNNKQNFTDLLQSIVQEYRPDFLQCSNFRMLCRPDLVRMLNDTLPYVVDQALSLPKLLENPIPTLVSNESKTIYLTRKLCCSLIANAFFCTFPEPLVAQMPDLNFFRLFNDTQSQRCEVKKEKIKCLLQYFQTMKQFENDKTFQNQIVSFERRYVAKHVNWVNVKEPLCEIKVEPYKKIEEAENMLQVDFANKVVGGGVLNDGSVMEEIRFCISPELLVSRLFTQALNDNEVLVVTGTEIFSRYSGYSTSFKYEGPSNVDFGKHALDNFGRTFTQVVAMDACSFKRNETAAQFQPKLIDRELHKSYVAFIHGKAGVSPVATGNWGCGAFNGNQELKFLIQWMAASHQGRPCMIYHTIGDKNQTKYIEDLSRFLSRKNVNVGGLYKSISEFSANTRNQNIQAGALFRHVKQYFKD